MSVLHSPSEYPARSMGPLYCLGCGSDWPCSGSRMEASERRSAITAIEAEARRVALSTATPTRRPLGQSPLASTSTISAGTESASIRRTSKPSLRPRTIAVLGWSIARMCARTAIRSRVTTSIPRPERGSGPA
jgi:hypothetical protein